MKASEPARSGPLRGSRRSESPGAAVDTSAALLGESWAESGIADPESFLARHPEVAAAGATLLDLALEEFQRRVERGETPDPDAFCDLFPTCKTELRNLL